MAILSAMLPLVRSPEDLATRGLNHVLASSAAARAGFNELLGFPDETRWAAQQVVPDEGATGRPDLAGHASGQVRGFVEAKFDAGLTEAQPLEYLDALPDGGRLVALVPQSRLNYLTTELCRRCTDHGHSVESDGREHVVLSSDRSWRLIVVTWDDVIGHLRRATDRPEERETHDDLAQLQDLVETLQKRLWTPITAEQLSSRELPQLQLQLLDLLRDLSDRLITHGFERRGKATSWISGSVAVPIGREGRRLAYLLQYDGELWRESAATPLYLAIHWDMRAQYDYLIEPWLHETQPRAFRAEHWNRPGIAIPLYILAGGDNDAVMDDLARQVSQHVGEIEDLFDESGS